MSVCVSVSDPYYFLFQDDDEDSSTSLLGQKKPGYHAPVAILNSIPQSDEQVMNRFSSSNIIFVKFCQVFNKASLYVFPKCIFL